LPGRPAALTPPDPPARVRWRAGVIVLVGFLAYANSLSGPFVMDDPVAITENESIREWRKVETALSPQRELPTAGRPLVNLSFALNYAVGGLDVRGYRYVNLACHLLSGLILFGVVRRTLELPRLGERFGGTALNLGFAVALLWTLHPLNTEAVNYLTQRTELMMALFYLLTMYAGVRALASKAGSWRALAVLSCAAGMACKESMVTAPVVVVLYDTIFAFGTLKQALRDRWRFYGALFASWLVLAAVNWSGPRVHSAGFSSGVSPWTYLLNQTVMITRYLRLAVWPRSLVANYGWPIDVTLGDVLPFALLITALLVLTALMLARAPAWGFLGAWFFVTLAPTSSIVPIATEVGAERRMYLPLVAIVVLAVVGASFVKRAVSTAGAVALVAVAMLLLTGTVARNREYSSARVLARTVVERYPTSVAHHQLGVALLLAGDRESAMRELRLAIPGAPRAYFTLGVELLKEGNTSEAIDQLQAFLREEPLLLEAVSARQLLGEALTRQQRWSEAIEQLQMVLTMKPSAVQVLDTHRLLADAFSGAGAFDEAIAHCRQYLRLRPNDPAVLTRLGIGLFEKEELDEAIAVFRRVAELDPASADAHRNLASVLYAHKDFADAATHAQEAVKLQPNDADAHVLLGRLRALSGGFDEAQTHFERALAIDPAHVAAKEDLGKLRSLMRQ